MYHRALPLSLALSLALATGPMRSATGPALAPTDAIVTCPGGQPADPSQPIQYTFNQCGARYTQDDLQLAFCPILGAYRNVDGTWQDSPIRVEQIQVNPQGGAAQASVWFPSVGEYSLVLSYTPFVYSLTQGVIEDISRPIVVSFQPPNPWRTAVISALTPQGWPATNLEITFSNWIQSVDPYEALTDRELGTFQIDCFTMDPVDAFVDDPRGCFQGPVRLQERGANIVLGSCEGF